MNKLRTSCIAGAVSLLVAIPCVAEQAATEADANTELPGVMATADATAVATVEAIDMDNRVLTLRRPDGTLVDLVAGDEVRNLAQVKVGDRVVVQHKIGLVMTISPADGSTPQRVDSVEAARAEPGEKPGGMVRKTVEAVGTVQAIDRKTRTVTLQGERHTVTLPVAEDVDLGAFEVGDRVDAVYQESLAISVEPAPAQE